MFAIDHFEPEKYKKLGLVKKGIYKYLNHPIYSIGVLPDFIPALLWNSWAGLCMALYILFCEWVHFFCTEQPDIQFIYGSHSKIK